MGEHVIFAGSLLLRFSKTRTKVLKFDSPFSYPKYFIKPLIFGQAYWSMYELNLLFLPLLAKKVQLKFLGNIHCFWLNNIVF